MNGPDRRIFGTMILTVLAVPGLTLAQQRQTPAPIGYRPALGDLMTMTVQPRHTQSSA
jgi:hypothetical protein